MGIQIRYGMVGGHMNAFIGEVHRKAIAFDPRAQLVAGCFSTNAEKNRETGETYSLDMSRVYPSYEAMAEAESRRPDGIDFVSITTPNNTHYDVAKCFLQHGIHVVCEKPLCFTVEQAQELVALAKEKNLVFGVTYTYSGYTMMKVAREMIAEGKIGKIAAVNAEYVQEWLIDELGVPGEGTTKLSVWRRSGGVRYLQLCGRHRHPHRELRPLPDRPAHQASGRHREPLRQGAGPERQYARRVRKRCQRRVLVLSDRGGQAQRPDHPHLRQRGRTGVGAALS